MSAPNKNYDPKATASLAPDEVARVLDEALAAVAAVEADDVQELANRLFVDAGLRMAAVGPARHLRGLERRLRLPG